MATTLLEGLRSKLEGAPAPQQTGVQDSTQQAQNLLRTKLGKQSTNTAAPRISNIQEQSQAQLADAGQNQQQLQGILRSEQLGVQEDQISIQENEQALDIKQKLTELEDTFLRRSDEILQDLARADKTLSADRKAAKLEQLGFMLRLQDKDYLAKLERAGRQARLESAIGFKEQLSQDLFKEDMDVFQNDVAFKEFINAEQREFDEMLNQMDINSALKIAKSKFKEEKAKAIWGGLGQMGSGAASAYGNSGGATQSESPSENMD